MKKIAVVFPGIGYHKDKPLLYYSARFARDAGYQIEYVDFSGIPWDKGDLKNPAKMKELFALTMEQAGKMLDGLDLAEADAVLFVSKSIGTAVAACYAEKNGLPAKQIFFSPVVPFGEYEIPDGIAFYGDADPIADWDAIEEILARKGMSGRRIAGGNHSLETGNAERDLENLVSIMEAVRTYIKET